MTELVAPPEPDGPLETTNFCGFKYWYRVYDDTDYDICGEPAVACDAGDGDIESGRCLAHTPEYVWLDSWGFMPPHKTTLNLIGGPDATHEPQL